jgi:hypothetical protein
MQTSPAFARSAFARHQAARLLEEARIIVGSCEREYACAELLPKQAREARAALPGEVRILLRETL